jgi:hypothetical protein
VATVTHRLSETLTTGTGPYTSPAFTPGAGELLVVFVVVSDSVAATAALTSSVAGFTYSQITRATYRTSLDSIYVYVSDWFAAAVSQTVTWTSADAATGHIFAGAGVAGMFRQGVNAVRQSAVTNNGAAAGTPATTFPGVALTGNACLGCVGNNSSPAAMTPPASFTEGVADVGYSTPATGGEYAFRNSGHTSATITWGGTSATTFGAASIELDTTAAPIPPEVMSAPRLSS